MSAWRRRTDQRAVQFGALALLLAATAAVLYHETRGTSFLFDDWSWILGRRGGSAGTYLDPHNEHLSLVPVAIYKALFATFGTGSYVPFRVVLIAVDLVLLGLLYVYARRRIGGWAALVVTAVVAVLGPGWEDILWPFQIGFLLSLSAGVGAMLSLDRRTRAGDVAASVLTAASLASSGVGLPIALGVVVDLAADIARGRRPPRDGWIVAVPFALFIAWWIGYQHGGGISGVGHAPGFVAKEAAAVAASVFGRAGHTGLDGRGTLTSWGTPLLIAALAVLALRLWRGRVPGGRADAIATMLAAFWIATAVSRGFLGNPFASRYIYVGAVLAVLLGVELAQGWHPGPVWCAVLAAVAGIAIGSNIGALRDAAAMLRGYGAATTADLGALELSRPVVPAGYVARGLPGYPFVSVTAQAYFVVARELGSPAAGVAQIESDDEATREIVDREVIAIQRLAPRPTSRSAGVGCQESSPPTGAGGVTVRPPGLVVRAGGGPVEVRVRRFAGAYQPVGRVPAHGVAALRIAPDRARVPWLASLSSTTPIVTCDL